MQLSPADPIRLDALRHALLSFVDLQYLRLGPEESLFDPAATGGREEAVEHFLTYLRDEDASQGEKVRRALAWVLNLPDAEFEATVRRLKIPVPRFDPADIRRLLELLWQRAWGGPWQVPGFDPAAYRLAPTG
jgi:hypothetical protein